MGFTYSLEKIKGDEYIKIKFPGTANVNYLGVRQEPSESPYIALVKNGKSYVNVSVLSESYYHVITSADTYDHSSDAKITHVSVNIFKAEEFKDLSKFYKYAAKENLYFKTSPKKNNVTVRVIEPITPEQIYQSNEEYFLNIEKEDHRITMRYRLGTDAAADNRAAATRAFVKILYGQNSDFLDEEYLNYFKGNKIDKEDIANFTEQVSELNPFPHYGALMISKKADIAYSTPSAVAASNRAGFLFPQNTGIIYRSLTEEDAKGILASKITEDKTLMGIFETYLNKYPNRVWTSTKDGKGTPQMLTPRDHGLYIVQDENDPTWTHSRFENELYSKKMIWSSYARILSADAIAISLNYGVKNSDELLEKLVTYTTGNKNDAKEIIKFRNEVMKAYDAYAKSPAGKKNGGAEFTGYYLPYVNKPYKLSSGTIIYLDMNSWYFPSPGPTVYIKKDLSSIRQLYYPHEYNGVWMMPEGYKDYKTLQWLTPKPFSWGKYK